MNGKAASPAGVGLVPFLKSHPVLFLLLLTPGIPEYLSSSSPINAIVLNPPQFVFQILANLGLYGSGALLIHDARVRWNKGWASVLLLGGAYGILEEGVALSTLFDPKAGPVGSLGVYGHWLGVNWVWAAGIVPFHAIFSVSIPILLLGLAIPRTATSRLLSRRGTAVVFIILTLDVIVLMAFVSRASGYWMGTPILAVSLVSILALVWLGRRVSSEALRSQPSSSRASNKRLAALGISFFPAVLLTEGLGQGAHIPAAADFALVLFVQALYLFYLTRRNWDGNERGKIAFVIGLVIPIMVFGVIAELALPMTLLADAATFLFFRRMWRKYSPKASYFPRYENRPDLSDEEGIG